MIIIIVGIIDVSKKMNNFNSLEDKKTAITAVASRSFSLSISLSIFCAVGSINIIRAVILVSARLVVSVRKVCVSHTYTSCILTDNPVSVIAITGAITFI